MSADSAIWVFREDRLGDVIHSLPSLEYLRRALPKRRIVFRGASTVYPAIAPFLNSREIEFSSATGPLDLSAAEGVLILQAERKSYEMVWRAGVKHRVANFSKWYSFAFVNEGLRQRRSQAEHSEAEYCLALTERLVRALGENPKPPLLEGLRVTIPLDTYDAQEATQVLRALGLQDAEKFGVVHPGMAGSARNLSARYWVECVDQLSQDNSLKVLLSEGPLDKVLIQDIQKERPKLDVIRSVSLGGLREILRKAEWLMAPSTGPLHLANAVGTPVFAVFSPIRSHLPARWGPVSGLGSVQIMVPSVNCPARKKCWGRVCPQFDCMERAPWGALLLKARDALNRRP